MTLSVFETVGVLASWFVAIWGYFTIDCWMDARAARKKAKAEFKAMPFAAKAKHVGNSVAKTRIGKSVGKTVSNGAKTVSKAVGVPIDGVAKTAVGAANIVAGGASKMADAAEKVAEVGTRVSGVVGIQAQKAGETVAKVAKDLSKKEGVKAAASKAKDKAKEAGAAVVSFFKLEAIEDDEDEPKEGDDKS